MQRKFITKRNSKLSQSQDNRRVTVSLKPGVNMFGRSNSRNTSSHAVGSYNEVKLPARLTDRARQNAELDKKVDRLNKRFEIQRQIQEKEIEEFLDCEISRL